MTTDQIGKFLILAGSFVILVGLFLVFRDRLGVLKYLGKLPGDIRIEGEGYGFYFPLATSIILSVVLSLILAIVRFLK